MSPSNAPTPPEPTPTKPLVTPKGIQLPVNPAWEIHPAQLQECLKNGEEILLLDVRLPREWNAARIQGATLIPLQELDARSAEIASWKDRPIITYCHHGVRSLNAAAFLRKKGFTNVHSLAGGIDAWSLIIDPALPRY